MATEHASDMDFMRSLAVPQENFNPYSRRVAANTAGRRPSGNEEAKWMHTAPVPNLPPSFLPQQQVKAGSMLPPTSISSLAPWMSNPSLLMNYQLGPGYEQKDILKKMKERFGSSSPTRDAPLDLTTPKKTAAPMMAPTVSGGPFLPLNAFSPYAYPYGIAGLSQSYLQPAPSNFPYRPQHAADRVSATAVAPSNPASSESKPLVASPPAAQMSPPLNSMGSSRRRRRKNNPLKINTGTSIVDDIAVKIMQMREQEEEQEELARAQRVRVKDTAAEAQEKEDMDQDDKGMNLTTSTKLLPLALIKKEKEDPQELPGFSSDEMATRMDFETMEMSRQRSWDATSSSPENLATSRKVRSKSMAKEGDSPSFSPYGSSSPQFGPTTFPQTQNATGSSPAVSRWVSTALPHSWCQNPRVSPASARWESPRSAGSPISPTLSETGRRHLTPGELSAQRSREIAEKIRRDVDIEYAMKSSQVSPREGF